MEQAGSVASSSEPGGSMAVERQGTEVMAPKATEQPAPLVMLVPTARSPPCPGALKDFTRSRAHASTHLLDLLVAPVVLLLAPHQLVALQWQHDDDDERHEARASAAASPATQALQAGEPRSQRAHAGGGCDRWPSPPLRACIPPPPLPCLACSAKLTYWSSAFLLTWPYFLSSPLTCQGGVLMQRDHAARHGLKARQHGTAAARSCLGTTAAPLTFCSCCVSSLCGLPRYLSYASAGSEPSSCKGREGPWRSASTRRPAERRPAASPAQAAGARR